jgi:hypothetical protein
LLQSGYALLVRGPDAGILSDNPAELPLIESKTVFEQSRPPLLALKTTSTIGKGGNGPTGYQGLVELQNLRTLSTI